MCDVYVCGNIVPQHHLVDIFVVGVLIFPFPSAWGEARYQGLYILYGKHVLTKSRLVNPILRPLK